MLKTEAMKKYHTIVVNVKIWTIVCSLPVSEYPCIPENNTDRAASIIAGGINAEHNF